MAKSGISVRLVIKGDDELIQTFRALPKAVARRVVRPAARAAIKHLMSRVKAIVPRDTGNLARSYKARATKKSRRWVGVLMTNSRKKDEDGFYAPFLEWGTSNKNGSVRIEARHYQEKTFEAEAPAMLRIFKQEYFKRYDIEVKKARKLRK